RLAGRFSTGKRSRASDADGARSWCSCRDLPSEQSAACVHARVYSATAFRTPLHGLRVARRCPDIALTTRSEIESALSHLAPRIPSHEFEAVSDHAVISPGLRQASPENAAWLSLVAYVRHTFTDYDELLQQDYDQDSARHFVAAEMETVLAGWGVKRKLGAD